MFIVTVVIASGKKKKNYMFDGLKITIVNVICQIRKV